jgi:hypothetical protein
MNLWKLCALFLVTAIVAVGCSTKATEPSPSTAVAPDKTDAAAAPAADAPKPATTPEAPAAPAPQPITVPAATTLNVVLLDALSSDKNKPGDTFQATLAAPLVVKGETILAKGAKVQGRVVDAKEAGKVKGRASMRLVLTSVTQGQKVIPIVTKPYVVEAEATKKRDAEIIGGAAGVGAAIGAIAGGGKGALIGAGVGGGAGTGTVLATKGKEVKFSPEAKLKFTLEKPVDIVPAAKKNT